MKIPATFTLHLLCVFILLSCGNADFNALMEREAVVNGAAEPGVTIFFPAKEEHLETLEKDANGIIVARQIVFQGAANDGYNKPITDDESFVWRSSIDGKLGTGRNLTLTAPLSPGTHQITLEVTDSYGGVDSRTVTVHYPRVFTEDFSTTTLADTANTTGAWDTATGSAHLGASINLELLGKYSSSYNLSCTAISGNYACVVGGTNRLEIVDISDPANPSLKGYCTLSGNAIDVAVSGNYAYIACWDQGLIAVNISNPANPTVAGSCFYNNARSKTVAVSGHYAYVADHNNQLLIVFDITTPSSPVYICQCHISGAVNMTVSGNYAYIAGNVSDLIIVDISSPALSGWNPAKYEFAGPGFGYDVAVSGNYAYIADVNKSGLLIVDISNPLSPHQEYFYATEGDPGGVTISGNYAYIGVDVSGLIVLDISNPGNPVLAGHYNTEGSASNVATAGDYVYVTDSSKGMVILNTGGYFTQEGTCFITGNARSIAVAGNYAFIANSGCSGNYLAGMYVVDIGNPASPTCDEAHYFPAYSPRGIAVSGDHAYLADYRQLLTIDISNPGNPVCVNTYNTSSDEYGIAVSGEYLYLGGDSGLQIFSLTNPAVPVYNGKFSTGCGSIALIDKYALATGGTSLYIIDVSNPSSPSLTGSYNTLITPGGVAVSGDYAYIADRTMGLVVININNRANPVLAGTYPYISDARIVSVSGNYAYVTAGSNGLYCVNVSDPYHPVLAGIYDTDGTASSVFLSGKYAYVADGSGIVITGAFKKTGELFNDELQEVRSSKVVSASFSNVRFLYESDSNYQYLDIQMSLDGGTVWNSAADSLRISLPETYSDLRWRALMRTFNIVETPRLSKISIEYWE